MSTIKNVAGTTAALQANGVKPYSEGTKKLQQELNKHIEQGHISGPRLREDGKEGPKTRAKMHELQNFTKAQQCETTAVVPAKPTSVTKQPTKPLATDKNETKYPTVGEYVDGQIKKVGQELKEDAQVAAVTAIAAPVVAVIEARHLNQARERIAKLPMDPDGKWKQEAGKIFAEEQAAAKKEILAIPGKVADGVQDAAVAVKDGVVDAAVTVKEGVSDAADAVADGIQDGAVALADGVIAVGDTVVKAGKAIGNAADAFGDKITEMTHDLKDDAQVIAVTAIAPIPAAVIQGKHLEQARERIAALPMDPEGKWKKEASKILAQEQAEAKAEIIALPGKVVDGVADFAGDVKDAALYVAEDVRRDVVRTGQTIVKGYKIAEFAVEEAVHDVKDAVDDTAKGLKSAALYVAEDVRRDVKEARQDVGGFFQRVGKWISGD